jgi:hypothetical protein
MIPRVGGLVHGGTGRIKRKTRPMQTTRAPDSDPQLSPLAHRRNGFLEDIHGDVGFFFGHD